SSFQLTEVAPVCCQALRRWGSQDESCTRVPSLRKILMTPGRDASSPALTQTLLVRSPSPLPASSSLSEADCSEVTSSAQAWCGTATPTPHRVSSARIAALLVI